MYSPVLQILADVNEQELDLFDGESQNVGKHHQTECFQAVEDVFVHPQSCRHVS